MALVEFGYELKRCCHVYAPQRVHCFAAEQLTGGALPVRCIWFPLSIIGYLTLSWSDRSYLIYYSPSSTGEEGAIGPQASTHIISPRVDRDILRTQQDRGVRFLSETRAFFR